MEHLNDSTRIPEILKTLMQAWMLDFPADQRPVVQVKEDDGADAAYTLGPMVTLITSREYEITALDDTYRFYMAPVNAAATGEMRKRLNEDRKRWIPTADGSGAQVPYVHGAWTLDGSTLTIARIDENSIRFQNGLEVTFSTKRTLLTSIFKDGFDEACRHAMRTPDPVETARRFGGFYSALSRQSLERVQKDIRSNEANRLELNRQHHQLVARLAQQREQERLLHLAVNERCGRTEAAVKRISQQLQSLVGERFQSISLSDTELVAVHTDVRIENADSGEESELGDIRCRIQLCGKELIRFEAAGDNEWRGNYFHPHVSIEGSPCLGNIGDDVNKLMTQREWGTLLLLLDEFLMSYNPSDPYVAWFNPESDEFDACLQSGEAECASCRDRDCPHWQSRWERCYESSTSYDCLDCANPECPYIDDVRDDCRADGGPYECLQCHREWCLLHPENEEDCRERNEPECSDCPHRSECSAWADDDEEDGRDEDGDERKDDEGSGDGESAQENGAGDEAETDETDAEGAAVG